MVTEALAQRLASEERGAYERAISGRYGDAERARAEEMGLGNIVERRLERRRHWEVHDMITGEGFTRPFPK